MRRSRHHLLFEFPTASLFAFSYVFFSNSLSTTLCGVAPGLRAAMARSRSRSRSRGNDGFYEILGVSREDSYEEIGKAYKKLSLKLHPDKGGSVDRFQKLSEAYEVLKDPELRDEYDSFQTHAAYLDFLASKGPAASMQEESEEEGGVTVPLPPGVQSPDSRYFIPIIDTFGDMGRRLVIPAAVVSEMEVLGIGIEEIDLLTLARCSAAKELPKGWKYAGGGVYDNDEDRRTLRASSLDHLISILIAEVRFHRSDSEVDSEVDFEEPSLADLQRRLAALLGEGSHEHPQDEVDREEAPSAADLQDDREEAPSAADLRRRLAALLGEGGADGGADGRADGREEGRANHGADGGADYDLYLKHKLRARLVKEEQKEYFKNFQDKSLLDSAKALQLHRKAQNAKDRARKACRRAR